MSNRGGGGVGGGMSGIPAASRKMVQSLKEIVNCPEPEIYHMLKECNMDPNEAVNRLLSQDPFHEVKSKREKKKENKDGSEHRIRGAYNSSNRDSRSGADRYAGRAGSNQFGSNDYGASHSKPPYKKENGAQVYAGSSSSASGVAGNSSNRRPLLYSESVATENKVPSIGSDSASSLAQPAFQSAWSGTPGQISMADIVKMGKPHNKAPGMAKQPQHMVPSQSINNESELIKSQNVEPHDEWPLIEQPSHVNVSPVFEWPAQSEPNLDKKNHMPVEDDVPVETHHISHGESVSHMQEDESKGASPFDNDISYQNKGSYHTDGHAFELKEAEDVTASAASNMQQLSLEKDEQGEQSEEDNPPVIIPSHLQVHAPECSQLSFGSFRCGVDASLPGPFASKPSEGHLDATSSEPDVAAVAHSDTGNSEYYGDGNLKAESTGNSIHGSGPSVQNYDVPVPQPEVVQHDAHEHAQGNQYDFSPSVSGHGYENQQQLNQQQLNAAAYSQPLTSPQMQNLAPFSNVMQAYTGSLQGTLLPSSIQNTREADLSYSQFPVAQSMPAKYNTGSSISGPTISMSEALRAAAAAGGISSAQPTQQTHPGADVATGPAVPRQLLHPYNQPSLPLGHYANMIGYPLLPQNYTYMPSAFQQAFANNGAYHQSLAAMLPQYKNSVSASNLPQSAAVAPGYGYGNSTNIPGQNFPLNAPAAPGGTTVGFDEVLSSQYKNLMSHQQQNENSPMWVHGAGSRTMSAVPANQYYSFAGQSQQPPGFRQSQQPTQHFGAPGYPNYYQNGMPLEQQQNARDGSLGGSQGQQVKQAQQLWQNGY